VLRFPTSSGDTALYEQIAANWINYSTYAMDVAGKITPVDIRVPGYPAFLAIIYALSRHSGASARPWVMLAQVCLDLITCFVIAALAALLISSVAKRGNNNRVFIAALWIASLCPLSANYTAVPLTEVFATFITAGALYYLVLLFRRIDFPLFGLRSTRVDS